MKRPKYPVYIISKGRHDCCLTAKGLVKDGVEFKLIVEPQEAELYAERFGSDCIEVLPFSNLGQGSIPARNWVWEHSKAAGHKRHWILDDNIRGFQRRFKGRRFYVEAGFALAISEEFTDRYENIAVAGLNYVMFAGDHQKFPPFVANVHVYSCLLILNELPQRWRGRYNEDTDLCLQVLAAGWCTVLFNAFLILKARTMTMKGGNSEQLYQHDGRVKMARSLERAWPHVVTVNRRFKRPQHMVRDAWKKFDTPLKRRADVDFDAMPKVDEHGMELKQVRPIKSEMLRTVLGEQELKR